MSTIERTDDNINFESEYTINEFLPDPVEDDNLMPFNDKAKRRQENSVKTEVDESLHRDMAKVCATKTNSINRDKITGSINDGYVTQMLCFWQYYWI